MDKLEPGGMYKNKTIVYSVTEFSLNFFAGNNFAFDAHEGAKVMSC